MTGSSLYLNARCAPVVIPAPESGTVRETLPERPHSSSFEGRLSGSEHLCPLDCGGGGISEALGHGYLPLSALPLGFLRTVSYLLLDSHEVVGPLCQSL